jgi:hypothetical protein
MSSGDDKLAEELKAAIRGWEYEDFSATRWHDIGVITAGMEDEDRMHRAMARLDSMYRRSMARAAAMADGTARYNTLYSLGCINVDPRTIQDSVNRRKAYAVELRLGDAKERVDWHDTQGEKMFKAGYFRLDKVRELRRQQYAIDPASPPEGMVMIARLLVLRPVVLLCACEDVYECYCAELRQAAQGVYGASTERIQYIDAETEERQLALI